MSFIVDALGSLGVTEFVLKGDPKNESEFNINTMFCIRAIKFGGVRKVWARSDAAETTTTRWRRAGVPCHHRAQGSSVNPFGYPPLSDHLSLIHI